MRASRGGRVPATADDVRRSFLEPGNPHVRPADATRRRRLRRRRHLSAAVDDRRSVARVDEGDGDTLTVVTGTR